MRRLFACAGMLFLGLSSLGAQTGAAPVVDGTLHFRVVHGLVLGLDGKPASQRAVHLIGLSRGSMRPYSDEPTILHWDFITDDQGRFSAQLGDFKTWEDKENRPGWGAYALYVDPSPQDAGAVSPRFWFDGRPEQVGYQANDEWGKVIGLPKEGISITLQIKFGVTLEGRMWDYTHPGKPLAGVTVSIDNDLHSDSHTGFGGEIFGQHTETDAQGRFTVKHIYPVEFHVGLNGIPSGFDDGAFWLKTKMAGQWTDTVGDDLAPQSGETVLHLELMGSTEPLFRYFGKVTDVKGQPVTGAKVTFGMSWNPTVKTWSDDHHYESAVTDSNGLYEIKLGTPWVRGMDSEATGFKRVDKWDDNSPTFSPGEYNFTLTRD